MRLKIFTASFLLVIQALLCAGPSWANAQGAEVNLSRSGSAKVSVVVDNASLATVFSHIEKQTKLKFSYVVERVDVNRKISLNLTNSSLDKTLKAIAERTGLSFYQAEGSILVKDPNWKSGQAEKKQVKGKVTDSKTGEGIPGVNVVVKGTTNGTITDFEGNFKLDVSTGDILLVTYVGYVNEEVQVGANTVYDIAITENVKELSEVVVIGYGTAKKSDLTGSVATVENIEGLKSKAPTNVSDMIQGSISGVTVLSNGGDPTAGFDLRIRGVGTINNADGPLWVVDGVIGAPAPKPNDIESISILKDAASASIYGAQAAGGVIMVTTKRGKKGTVSVDFEMFTGIQQAWKTPKALDAKGMSDFYLTAARGAGKSEADIRSEYPAFVPDLNPNGMITRTDWTDEIFRTAKISDYHVRLSGGNDKVTYLTSLSYQENEGTIRNTFAETYNFLLNADMKLSEKMRIGQHIKAFYQTSRGANTDDGYGGAVTNAIWMPPSASVYGKDGKWGGVAEPDDPFVGSYGDIGNPVAALERNNAKNPSIGVDANLYAEYSVFDFLKARSSFSIRGNMKDYERFFPKVPEPGRPSQVNTLDMSSERGYRYLWENTLTFDKNFDKHHVTAMVGYTAQKQETTGFSAGATGFDKEDDYFIILQNGGTVKTPTSWTFGNSMASVLGRVAYSYADKYFLTANYRRDASSKLSPELRSDEFPAFSAAWRISEEPFMEGIKEQVSSLKLRASWGQIGNVASLGNNDWMLLYSPLNGLLGQSTGLINGYAPLSEGNPNLLWETGEQTDIGIDAELFGGRVIVTADYFNKLTDGMIMRPLKPGTSGVQNSAFENVGAVRNRGFEVELGYRKKEGDFRYSVFANVSMIENEATDLGEAGAVPVGTNVRGVLRPYRHEEGHPLSSFYLIRSAGIFQSDAEAEAYVDKSGKRIQPNAQAGDLKFIDLNGDGVISDLDRDFVGDPYPDFTYGLNANASYKNFDFSMIWQGVSGVDIFNAYNFLTLSAGFSQGYNMRDGALDAWSETNKGSDIPRLTVDDRNGNYATSSDWYLKDGSYLRLRSVTLGYTLPQNILDKTPFSRFRVYVAGRNLLTITDYDGMDPEIGFNGLDQGKYPVAKQFLLGLNVSF
ncbi:SusC/RagA family TonB-linked outer membrane protein (plasmid) [Fulvitalea axinellae]|uniref:SusC/RagA family TonB-linked outer membrane protein n=1 Tax=Fulvitalea axinellae TaxID=1182444 RepID=A0AAU9DIB6_9BACT|nr:SusC/RagA family TonB-linked outer membrane protein [Fulvitalea axinellae]